METDTEPRDLALHEAFVAWLARRLEIEWSTDQLVKAYANASLDARALVDASLTLVPERAALFARALKHAARDQRRMVRIELEGALDEEHNSDSCGNNSCDITMAVKADLFAWAANLLTNATECPATTEAYAKYAATFLEPGEFDAHLDAECRALLEVDHAVCGACNSNIWQPDRRHGDRCGNCLAPVVKEEPDDDDAAS